MATPILNADLRLRIQTIQEELEKAQTAAKSLLVLRERVLVVSALRMPRAKTRPRISRLRSTR